MHPTLAYGHMSTTLKAAGHEVCHVDLPLIGNEIAPLAKVLDDFTPELVGVSCVAQSYRQALEVTRAVRDWDRRVPTVLGGPHVTFIDDECLNRHESVDFVLRFDAETSIVDLADSLAAEPSVGRPRSIPGLSMRTDSGIIRTAAAAPLMNLDALGHPDRSIFDLATYLDNDYETVVVSARGCPSHCTFCSTQAAGRTYRAHSVQYVIDEIIAVLDAGFTSIYFGDDTIAGDRRRLLSICEAIESRRLPVAWTSNIRGMDVDAELLERMRAAGAYRVFTGFESVNYDSLKLMGKGRELQRSLQVARTVQAAGLELHASFIVGAPGDTPQTIRDTLDFVREINPTVATFNPFEPRPGTPMYAHAKKFGIIMDDPYWYEDTRWLTEPVAYTSTMSAADITAALYECYTAFCSTEFVT
ncbi:radical SAM protein [Gordonia sp. JH63]|uniref:B12-binding domain-containing radical SAM protein n=1 Tax=Gordonia sp. JH63 TaxID=2698900 RepID=UPI0031B83AF2